MQKPAPAFETLSDFAIQFPGPLITGHFYKVWAHKGTVYAACYYANGHLNREVSRVEAPLEMVEAMQGAPTGWAADAETGYEWLFEAIKTTGLTHAAQQAGNAIY